MLSNKHRAAGAWLVTGAASGFGREVATRLVRRGEPLVALDRDEDALERLEGELGAGRLHRVVADVTDPDAVRRAVDDGVRALGPIAHVFHSAGVLSVGPAESMDPALYRRMIEINYLGTVHVCQAVLPSLRAAGRGGRATLNLVASVAGLRGFPELAGYSASKFAVVGFAQALRDELRGSGVSVRVLCPPAGDTPMVRSLEKLPPIYKLSPMFSAEQVIDGFFDGLDKPGWVALVDLRSKALWRVGRIAPRVLDWVVRRAT